jgi:hypothetical protein
MGVFSQVVTLPLLTTPLLLLAGRTCHTQADRAALVSASGQCKWPVVPKAIDPEG